MLHLYSNTDWVRRRSPDTAPLCRVPNVGPIPLKDLPIRVDIHQRDNQRACRFINILTSEDHIRSGAVKSRIVNNISCPCKVTVCTAVHSALLAPDQFISFVDVSDQYSTQGVIDHYYDILPIDIGFAFEPYNPLTPSTVEVGLRVEPLTRSIAVTNKTPKTFRLVIYQPISYVLYNFPAK